MEEASSHFAGAIAMDSSYQPASEALERAKNALAQPKPTTNPEEPQGQPPLEHRGRQPQWGRSGQRFRLISGLEQRRRVGFLSGRCKAVPSARRTGAGGPDGSSIQGANGHGARKQVARGPGEDDPRRTEVWNGGRGRNLHRHILLQRLIVGNVLLPGVLSGLRALHTRRHTSRARSGAWARLSATRSAIPAAAKEWEQNRRASGNGGGADKVHHCRELPRCGFADRGGCRSSRRRDCGYTDRQTGRYEYRLGLAI